MPRIPLLFALLAALMPALAAPRAWALERIDFTLIADDGDLRERLRAASLLVKMSPQDAPRGADIIAAAMADYARLTAALYETGRYGGIVHILLDGREAASIAPFDAPGRVEHVGIRIDPGPIFRLRDPRIAPLAPDTRLPPAFADGQIARAGTIRDAANAAIEAWRAAGHAKARLADQKIVADHARARLSARIRLDPGPRLRFGQLKLRSPSAVRPEAIRRIAGLPTGKPFSPAALEKAANRLRQTGAFSAVTLSQADAPRAGDLLDIDLSLADLPPRRIGLGAEISSSEGVTLAGFWLHRNLLGGAERLRIEAAVPNLTDIGGGRDFRLSARLDVPAALGTDMDAWGRIEAETLNEPAYSLRQGRFSMGLSRRVSEALSTELSLSYRRSQTADSQGRRGFTIASLRGGAVLDRRDDRLNPAAGYFIGLDAEPFHDIGNRGSGIWAKADLRYYRSLSLGSGAVLAARLQLGQTLAPAAEPVHPDFLFWSGGPATVRGQPYKSLGRDLGGGAMIGGRAFAGLSLELRQSLGENLGIVGFVDLGHVGADGLLDGAGSWHAGAGLGLRYQTGLGPLRLDVAVPVGPRRGGGAQIYLGIGQAF